MLRITKPSARSAFSATSLTGCPCLRSCERRASLAASIRTSSGLAPEPSIWRLQRLQGPASGIPCRSCRGGSGGLTELSERPPTKIRLWSLGQWTWYSYDAALAPLSDFTRYCEHLGSLVGFLREGASV